MSTQPKLRTGAALEFLREVTPPGLHSTVVAIDPESGTCVGRAYKLDSLEDVGRFIAANEHRNLYWTPNPLKHAVNKKPTKSDVLEMVWVHLDLDDPSPEALARLRDYRVPPTIIVFSGGGYQAFWLLRAPVRAGGNLDTLEAANKRVADDLGGDPGTWNIDRIMRLPGTTNWPTPKKIAKGRTPSLATLIEHHPERVYNLDDFPPTTVVQFPANDDRSVDLMTRVSADVRAGLEDAAIHARYDDHPHVIAQSNPARAVQRCIEKTRGYWDAKGTGPQIEKLSTQEMLRRFVYVSRDAFVVDLENVSVKHRIEKFHGAYAASIEGDGKSAKAASYLWASHPGRATAYELGFDPLEGRFYTNNGRIALNLWHEPVWPETDVTLAAPFLDHLAYVVPGTTERNHLLDWLAAIPQQPGIRPHYHFLLLAEAHGIGRSWIGDMLQKILGGDYAVGVDLHRLLEADFNAELSCKLLVIVSETKAPASERYRHDSRLKSLLTDSRHTINEKNISKWVEKNCGRYLLFTNDVDALPIAEGDRRIYAVQCASEPQSPGYYKELYARLHDQQFLAAVWCWLKSRDLSAYNPGMTPPLTAAKQQMADSNRTDEQQLAVDFVRHAPFDIIHAADLWPVIVPPRDHESEKERNTRIRAVQHALRAVGVTTAECKVRAVTNGQLGAPQRVWILRNAGQWRNAGPDQLRTGIDQARGALAPFQDRVAAAVGAWASVAATATPTKHEF